MRVSRFLVAAGLFVAAAALGRSDPGLAPAADRSRDFGSTLAMPNGVQLFVAPRPGSRTVFVEIGVRVGARDEPLELAGMSHLLEHLLFKEGHGRKEIGAAERNPAFSALRAAGAEINASTDFELTEYHADLPASRFEEGWRALVAMVTRSGAEGWFDIGDLRRERGVVLQEIALGKTDPLAIMAYSLLARVFPGDPIGQPVIGRKRTLERITVRDLEDYHRRYYVPSNMFVVIAGDVDLEFAARLVRETLGRSDPNEPADRLQPSAFSHPSYPPVVPRLEPSYDFRTLVSQTYLLAGALTRGDSSGDAPALELLATILGDGKSSRLHRRLVERAALSDEVLAVSFDVSNAGAFACGLAVAPARAEVARAALVEELARLAAEPVTDEEIGTARMQARGRLARRLETNAGVAGFAARRLLLRQAVDRDATLARFERLSPADLQAVAARTWGPVSGAGIVRIRVVPARGFGKVLAALRFLIWKRI